jgi:hypothetical protein
MHDFAVPAAEHELVAAPAFVGAIPHTHIGLVTEQPSRPRPPWACGRHAGNGGGGAAVRGHALAPSDTPLARPLAVHPAPPGLAGGVARGGCPEGWGGVFRSSRRAQRGDARGGREPGQRPASTAPARSPRAPKGRIAHCRRGAGWLAAGAAPCARLPGALGPRAPHAAGGAGAAWARARARGEPKTQEPRQPPLPRSR